jgi:two-component system sensor histidine kinase RegB
MKAPVSGDAGHPFLRQLCMLRWLAIFGQAITIYIVTGPLDVALSPQPLWAGVAVLAWFNLYAILRSAVARDARPRELFVHLLVDIAVLSWQVGWSGGIENPFASLFLLPIALSILALPPVWIWYTAAASLAGFALCVWLGRPLPHVHVAMGDTFNLHKAGMLVNFILSAVVLLVFVARLAALSRAREHELAILRERFARNEGIVALATHAASVAHELNTPLATLTLMVDEMKEHGTSPPLAEHAATMRQLIDQCRDRVRALAAPAHAGAADAQVNLEDVVDRWQLVRPTIELNRSGSIAGHERVDAAVGHLLQALLNNAADASESSGSKRVDLWLEAIGETLAGEIRDYGAGFGQTAPLLPGTLFRTNKPHGLGIGLALSHATVERLGGQLSMQEPEQGPGIRVAFKLPLVAS